MPETTPDPQPVRVLLLDGTPAVVRRIKPEDVRKLENGLRRLSYESRTRRFFYNKTRFSEKELLDFTNYNVQVHLALVMGILDQYGNETDTVAIAHCFRDQEDPRSGEVTITTIDEWQGVGIGTILVKELALRCQEVGISFWKIAILVENRTPLRIIEMVGKKLLEKDCGSGAVEVLYELHPVQTGYAADS